MMAMLLTVHDVLGMIDGNGGSVLAHPNDGFFASVNVGAAFRDGTPRPHELERLFLGCIVLEHWTRGHGAAL